MNQHQKAVQKEDDGDSRKKEKPLNEVKPVNSQSFQRKTHVQKEIPLPSKLLDHAYD